MKTEYFIAKRIASSARGGKQSVIVRVAAVSVALSLAVMIVALAVIFGFDSSLRSNLMALDAHITVKDYRSEQLSLPTMYSQEVEEAIVSTSGYLRHSTFALSGVIFRSNGNIQGAQLRGVDSLFDWSLYDNERLKGELPNIGSSKKDILLSEALASALDIDIGGRLELLYTAREGTISRDLYKVCGVYSTGIEESDKVTALCDIASLSRTMNWAEGSITGYHVTLHSGDEMDEYAMTLSDKLFYLEGEGVDGVAAYTFEELNPQVISWLSTHDVNGAVIIVVMVIVAAFNMASALLIMVLERRRMVGILKSLGMDNRALGNLFILRSLYIILTGVVWGNIVGIALSLMQQRWQFISLDSEGYLLSAVPIELGVGWIVLLNIATISAIMLLIALPSRFVTRIEPCEAIKI